MLNNIWKNVKTYTVIHAKMTGFEYDDRIIEICCVKVSNETIVDTFRTKVNPVFDEKADKYFDLEKNRLLYADDSYPSMKELAPIIFNFAKGTYFVGWNTNNTLGHIIREGKIDYFKNTINVKYGDPIENGDLMDNCLKIMTTYERIKKYNVETYELPKKKYRM